MIAECVALNEWRIDVSGVAVEDDENVEHADMHGLRFVAWTHVATLTHYADFVGIVCDMTYSILVGAVYALAVARITRLINADTILDRPRLWIASRARDEQKLADGYREKGISGVEVVESRARRWSTLLYFVQCPWCVGMWLAFGTAWIPLWFHTNAVTRYVGIALAVSHLVGVCAHFADTEEIDYEDETVS